MSLKNLFARALLFVLVAFVGLVSGCSASPVAGVAQVGGGAFASSAGPGDAEDPVASNSQAQDAQDSGAAEPGVLTTSQEMESEIRPDPNTAAVSGWTAQYQNAAFFMTWTENGSKVSGTFTEAVLPEGGLEVVSNSSPFAGEVSGDSVTLNLGGTFGATLSGTRTANQIVLVAAKDDGTLATYTFQPGTADEHNSLVQALGEEVAVRSRQSASSQAQADAQAAAEQANREREQAVDDAIDGLEMDLEYLNSEASEGPTDADSLEADLETLEADLAEMRDMAASLAGQDPESPEYCLSDFEYSVSSAEYDRDGILYDTDSSWPGYLEEAVADVKASRAALDRAAMAVPSYRPGAIPAEDVATALEEAESALASWNSTAEAAEAEAAEGVQEANTLLSQATDSVKC